jgi:peptide/nickel transport system substrate-binding protein
MALAAALWAAGPLGADTLRALYPEAPRSLDPHLYPPDPNAYPVIMNAYKRLFDLSDQGSDLDSSQSVARTVRVSDDGLMYTVIMREGETFADGSPVNPEAVLFSFDRLMASDAGKALFPYLKYMRIDGPNTFAMILERPWPPFLASLTLPQASIISPVLAGMPSDHLREHTLGSGRYVVDLVGQGRITMAKRPELASTGSPQRVEFIYEPDPAKRLAFYKDKDAQLALLDGPPGEGAPEGALPRAVPSWTTRFLAFNTERPYVATLEAREGLALMAEYSFSSMPVRSQGLLPRGFQGAPAAPPSSRLEIITAEERAKEMIQAAGKPKTPLSLVYRPSEPDAYRDAAYLCERFHAMGVPVNAVPLQGRQGDGILERGDYDMYLGTRHPEIPSPEMWLGKFLDSKASVNSNPARYKNAVADGQIADFDASQPKPERDNRVKALASLAGRERPYVLLYQMQLAYLADRRLADVSPHPMWPLYWPIERVNLSPFRQGIPQGPKPPPEPPKPEAVRDFDEPVAEFYE